MAISLLAASEQIPATPQGSVFYGELGLDGATRLAQDALAAVLGAKEQGMSKIFISAANVEEASLAKGICVYPVQTLRQLYRHLIGEELIAPIKERAKFTAQTQPQPVNLAQIYGQEQAKRALEIAAAGNHNILLSGPPGTGKTLLAKALAGILPPLSYDEMLEVSRIHSLAGISTSSVVTNRPFRSPHHTASDIALIGGGQYPKPGEISLSHRGVLFLDELPEFPRRVLEVMRQPLEEGTVTISRAAACYQFPARLMLIAAQNPCPCGYAGDPVRQCSCSLHQIGRYQARVSGPLLDRIDLHVTVARLKSVDLLERHDGEDSGTVAARVQKARMFQIDRFKNEGFTTNSEMGLREIEHHCQLDGPTKALAELAISRMRLSARSYTRVLKVSRTIADLDGSKSINKIHFSEALQYRSK